MGNVFWVKDFSHTAAFIVRMSLDDVHKKATGDTKENRRAVHVNRGDLLRPFWQGAHPFPPSFAISARIAAAFHNCPDRILRMVLT